jgi:hypothetical protein
MLYDSDHVTYLSLIEGDSFSFACIDDVCVAAALRKTISNATALDGIPLVFIKFLLPLILPVGRVEGGGLGQGVVLD